MDRENYMDEALLLALKSAEEGEVPVGCVITDSTGNIIGKGRNMREKMNDPTAHAEMIAIREACSSVGDWRLNGCTIYITLEPCPMCAGTIIQARIPNIVFGAADREWGACGSVIDLMYENFHHRAAVYRNVRGKECAELLKSFFKDRR